MTKKAKAKVCKECGYAEPCACDYFDNLFFEMSMNGNFKEFNLEVPYGNGEPFIADDEMESW